MSGFFGMVFGVYIAINAYLFARLFSVLAGTGAFRAVLCGALFVFAAAFPAGRILSDKLPEAMRDALVMMGNIYISPMLYGFLFALAADILRLVNKTVAITHNPPPYPVGTRLLCAAVIFSLSLIVTAAGIWNANSPVAVEYDAHIIGRPGFRGLKIALLSDIHLGTFTGPKYLRKLAGIVNGQFPDIVLLAGDTVDGADFFRDAGRMRESAEALSSFKSRLGTWAVPGNHDNYAGIERVSEFFKTAGVTLLRDETVTLDGAFTLAGRDDFSSELLGSGRKSLSEILSARDGEARELPVILMDHQPRGLSESEEARVAVQVSGHTHRGQLWPINFIVSRMYERSYGEYKKGGTLYYISSGAGVWGPPVRTVGRPEVVIINLRGGEDDYEKWRLRN